MHSLTGFIVQEVISSLPPLVNKEDDGNSDHDPEDLDTEDPAQDDSLVVEPGTLGAYCRPSTLSGATLI